MKRIVVVGISPAAIKVAEIIRSQNQEDEILIFALEGVLPYNRLQLADVLAKETKEAKIFLHPDEFYKSKNIHILLDKQISRINIKRKRIYTEEKDQIDYDVLILADTAVTKLPDIKGTNKSGVFLFKKLKHLKEIQKALALTETVAIESSSIQGIKTALACQKAGRETILIVPSKYLLSDSLDSETAQILGKMIENAGVQLVLDNSITEILGDSETKAIRLKSGKVFAAQMVIFLEAQSDLKILSEQEIEKGSRGFAVDLSFRTNAENVFAIDQLGSFKDNFVDYRARNLGELEQEGSVAAKVILGEQSVFFPPFSITELTFDILDIQIMGKTFSLPDNEEHVKYDETEGVYKKIFVREKKVVGAILINAASQKEKFVDLIKNQTVLTYPVSNLLDQAQETEDQMIRNESTSA